MSAGTAISTVATDESTSSTANKDWTKRLKAYTDWLNLQLKKHPSSRKVTDLRSDLQDGVIIAQLIEALGGDRVTGINQSPTSPNSRKENVERIFEHFTSNKVLVYNCRVKDVLAGDPKCIMRLIHAVASHYRPESVLNPPAVSSSMSSNASSLPRIGSKATVGGDFGHHHHSRCSPSSLPYATVNNSRDTGLKSTSSSSSSLGRPKSQQNQSSAGKKKLSSVGVSSSAVPIRRQPLPLKDSLTPKPTSGVSFDSKRNPLRKSFTSLTAERLHRKSLLGTTANSSSSSSSNTNISKEAPAKISCKVAPLQLHSLKSNIPSDVPELHSLSKLTRKKSLVSKSEPCSLDSVDLKNSDESVEETDKKNPGKTCSCSYSSLTNEEIVELLKEIQEAKNQLLMLQDLLLHGNGGKFMKNSADLEVPYHRRSDDGLASPTIAANQQVHHDTTMKEFMNNNNNSKRSRPTEPLSMVKKLLSYVSVCGERKTSDSEDQKPKPGPPIPNRNVKDENDVLRKTIQEKELEIRRLKVVLSQMGTYEKKPVKYPCSPAAAQTQREELQVVHEALTSLRKCFPANDPYQHTLDTIEQSLSALLERVNCLEIGVLPPQASTTVVTTSAVPSINRGINNYEVINDGLRKSLPKTSGFNAARHDESRSMTKVVYYMDKSVTPFRCVLNKRIGEATLRDFKLLFDRPGQYRYHFKTLDPEFGMVKEEVLHDDDILPGWDGKIIAWIEEDCS